MNTQQSTTEPSPDKCWYYTPDRRQRLGPHSAEEMRLFLAEGMLKLTDMVWKYGTSKWIEAARVSEFEPLEPDKCIFPPGFLKDLEVTYRKTAAIQLDPLKCLPILSDRFEKRKSALRGERKRFTDDLTRLYDQVHVDPRRYLKILANRLAHWRSHTLKELQGRLSRMEREDPQRQDPLFSSINLFGTMDHGRYERAHTKVLAWFLDPHESHGFDSLLLSSLWQQLQGDQKSFKLIDASVRVESEKRIDEGKKLDVFVEVTFPNKSKSVLVIEAKIDAQESDGQLEAYDKWIDRQGYSVVTRVFLTPDGRPPDTSDKNWQPLTFLKLGCIFRSNLARFQQESRAGYHFLRYYLTGIFKDIYDWNLPLSDPEKCEDPYGFLFYLRSVTQVS